ncbi:RraA family protein [Sinisalibacter aestuarii]|uniref:Putative 4-hydroxy-4-methyl-2-oxoglutarate aldolase n=1 Tax=Sinisalibacter aestuarii TaxID=2949426 RepID=A0ABQ5LZQ7_9RHOB|nr:RraA family protein [Sinisalibacter aestuarii]GKY89946.1 diguanylate cyclase [Sinisalibacter aestuarii]
MADELERLARLDACAVSDAMDALGLGPALTGLGRLSGEGLLVGRIRTVELAAGPAPADAPKVHLGARAIAGADGETVIVVAHPGIDAGGWGGVLSNAAQIAGVRGVVVDGPVRDIDEARGLGFALFARGTTARTARGRVHEVATGGPIEIDGLRIEDGDYIVADGSGTVVIPAASIAALLDKAEAIAAREAAMTRDLRAGVTVTEVMGADYETMLETK